MDMVGNNLHQSGVFDLASSKWRDKNLRNLL